ncbi:hypothetical protein KFL_002060180 [Klebsormidium nitens]|uniref:Uncharacterized protein n=1 Tax=Klebsormidium nitens TaxID=105231 RepID=A0A1Y1I7W9_KLENI|nr:hypothetical protein KFL_002060180 [Klebsormidium nitens]|eukprot:GAQ84797.1 hypothetical protein KFL_002060180 [Klebsormidium nitens]
MPTLERCLLLQMTAQFRNSLAWRVFGYLVIASDPTVRNSFFALLSKGDFIAITPDMLAHYFLLEALGLSLSFAYFALLEDGARAALGVLGGALALGPAPAVALYLASRERRIHAAVEKEQGAAESVH